MLRQPVEAGKKWTRRDHLENAARQGNAEAIAQLEAPDFPEALEYLWEQFLELDRCRRVGMNGPEGLTYTDIDAWARLMGRVPSRLEIQAFFTLDVVVRFPDAVRITTA